jgi:hypothetical protein
MNITYGVFGDIHPIGFHSSLSQGFNEKTQSAASIQNGFRLDTLHNLVGDAAKEAQPTFIALVRPATARSIVMSVK